MARLYEALGRRIFDAADGPARDPAGARAVAAEALAELDLPAALLAALDDTGRDVALQAEGEEALALTGRDVGTPILHISPPEGAAFFGPVISRLPVARPDAGELWDHVVGLADVPGLRRAQAQPARAAAAGVVREHRRRRRPAGGLARR